MNSPVLAVFGLAALQCDTDGERHGTKNNKTTRGLTVWISGEPECVLKNLGVIPFKNGLKENY